MSDADEPIIRQLSEIVEDLKDKTNSNGWVEEYDARRIATRARAAIVRYAPPGSAYEEDATAVITGEVGNFQWRAEQLTAIAHALRDDYTLGGLLAVEEIVHADLFDDFLGMAGELLAKGFVGPAAVLAGTVLEEQLRKLAARNGIDVGDAKGRPRSVDHLATELRKSGAISQVQRKSVVAWYGQRNEGAHGHSENLLAAEVERMIGGVRDFIALHAA
jgi:hypothetical protein